MSDEQKLEKNNIEFWDSVEQTNTDYIREGTISGQKRTMVSAQHKKKEITVKFGMYGLGWGVVVGSENYERQHFENSTCILYYTAVAFYIFNEKRGEFPIASSIKEAYITKSGNGYLRIDDEAVKKVRTDALTKGFTELGFNADIFMGLFDDQNYVEGAKLETEINKTETMEKAIDEAIKSINEYCKKELEFAVAIKSDMSFYSAMKRIKSNVEMRCKGPNINPLQYIKLINKREEERKNGSE